MTKEDLIKMLQSENDFTCVECEKLIDIYINNYNFSIEELEKRIPTFSITKFTGYDELFEYGDPELYQKLLDKDALIYFDCEHWAQDYEMNSDCDISEIEGSLFETWF